LGRAGMSFPTQHIVVGNRRYHNRFYAFEKIA
jgi:hypothetical protein